MEALPPLRSSPVPGSPPARAEKPDRSTRNGNPSPLFSYPCDSLQMLTEAARHDGDRPVHKDREHDEGANGDLRVRLFRVIEDETVPKDVDDERTDDGADRTAAPT